MAEKLLYADNYQEHEAELARCLAQSGKVGCDEVILAHTSNTQRALQHIPTLLKDDVMRCVAEKSRLKLDEMAKMAESRGVPVRTVGQDTDVAWIGICELAKKEKPFLIVTGPGAPR